MDRVAAAPLRKEAVRTMTDFLHDKVGNPSAHIHSAGIAAASYIETARKQVANLINAPINEIIFTSGATESNNLAIKGYLAAKQSGDVLISELEHYSIIDQTRNPVLANFKFIPVKVDRFGLVDPDKLIKAITPDTILVSIQTANPEIGTVQPIKELAAICQAREVPFHTDATAALGYLPIDIKGSGIDMMTLSAQTIGGPMGIGALYLNKRMALRPVFDGGNQELGLRPGTENVAGIVGFGAACEAAKVDLAENSQKLSLLGKKLWAGLQRGIEHLEFTGHPERRLPGHVSFWHRFIEGESLLLHLNIKGVIAASGSACSSNLKGTDEHDLRASHVLTAVGVPEEYCSGSITFSLDYNNNENEIEYVIEIMPEIVRRLEAMSPVYEDYIKQRESHG